jgi:hypothetical protein
MAQGPIPGRGPASAGVTGVFLPGDEHDALYAPGSLYAPATLDADRLEAAAAVRGLVLDRRALGGTGIHPRRMQLDALDRLRRQMESVHGGSTMESLHGSAAGQLLDALIEHLARETVSGRRTDGDLLFRPGRDTRRA